MTDFKSNLASERRACHESRLDAEGRLPALRASLTVTEEARDQAYVRRQRTFGCDRVPSPEEERLDSEARSLRSQITSLEGQRDRSIKRIREIDRLLNAEDEADHEKTEMSKVAHEAHEAASRSDQLSSIEKELVEEIAELERGADEMAKRRVAGELERRLAGSFSAPLVATDDNRRDLESRRATLVAAKAAQAELKESLRALNDEHRRLRDRYLNARGRMAELALLEALQSALPFAAEMLACHASIGSIGDIFRMIDEESIGVARAAIQAELEETPAAESEGGKTRNSTAGTRDKRAHAATRSVSASMS